MAYGILVPWPGIEPMPPAVEACSFSTGPPGKFQRKVILFFQSFSYFYLLIRNREYILIYCYSQNNQESHVFTQEQCCYRNFPLQPVTAVAPESRSTSAAAGCCLCFFRVFFNICLFIFWLLWGSQAFSSCGEQGLLSKMRCLGFSLHRLPTAAASLAAEHGVYGTQAQSPGGVWNLPRPGIEPMSPTLVGGLLTTEPQRKSRK